VAKPELGTKRLCANCGARFYDLNHAPAECPKCGTVFEAAAVTARSTRPDPRVPAREVEEAPAEPQEAEFVSLEEADEEVHGAKKKPAAAPIEGEEDVDIDDEGMDDLIEEPEEEDTDVTEIIGNDIENEEET